MKESREGARAPPRRRAASELPHNKRVTVSLAPADLPKESGRFDLPIALGILAASGQIDVERLEAFEFAGELSLGGELRPVHGALAVGLLRRAPPRTAARACWCCRWRELRKPRSSAALQVRGARHLLDVVRALLPGDAADASGLHEPRAAPRRAAAAGPDLRDVKGQAARPSVRSRSRPRAS